MKANVFYASHSMRRYARLVKVRHRNDGQATGREEEEIRTRILQIPSLASQRQEKGASFERVSQTRAMSSMLIENKVTGFWSAVEEANREYAW